MYFQSTDRNQRPRGFNVKQCFQLTMILAICIWFLYQIKHPNDTKNDSSLQAKFSKGNSVVILGRKGNVELSDKTMYMSDPKDAILEAGGKQKDRGGGDDELDGNIDEKGQIGSFDKRVEYIHGNAKTDAEEGKKLEPERRYNLSTNSENIQIEMRDMDNKIFSEDKSQEQEGLENSKRTMSNLDGGGDEKDQKMQISYDERRHKSGAINLVEQGDDKDLERHPEELQREKERSIGALNRGKHEETGSSEDNGEDTDFRSKEITEQVTGTDNATILSRNEVAKGLHGFHDENGVPQGGNDLVEFTLARSRDDEVNDKLHQEAFSTSYHQSKLTESPHIKKDASKSERNSTNAKKTLSRRKKAQIVMLESNLKLAQARSA